MAPKSRGKKGIESPKATEKAISDDGPKQNEAAETSKPEPAPWKVVASAVAIMVLAGIASPVSQANLSPVYGSIPAATDEGLPSTH